MRGRYFWLPIVLTALAVAVQPIARGDRETGPDRAAKTTVSFELYRDYLIVVRGAAGPLKGLNFLLDTGATPSVLDLRIARKLHLDTAPTDIAVLNGSVQGGMATVPRLEFGPIRRDNLPVLIEDLSFLQKALPVQVDGMIGLDLLGDSTFVIDYTLREIRFGPVPSMPVSIPLQLKQGLPIVDATINHAVVHLLLDTGAPSLILFQEMSEPASGASVSSKAIGDFDRRQVRLASFQLGVSEFGRKPAFMVHTRRDAGHNFDGLMSPAALGITRLAFDPGRGTLAFAREH
jgi:hypothetical protein